jgi:hypothetical protein
MAADKNTKLSDKEAALIAAAKSELAAARKPGAVAAAAPPLKQAPTAISAQAAPVADPVPFSQPASDRPAAISVAPKTAVPQEAQWAAAHAERMAQLMAEEAAEHRRRHKRLRLYLISIPLGVLVLAFLWLLFTTLPRLR